MRRESHTLWLSLVSPWHKPAPHRDVQRSIQGSKLNTDKFRDNHNYPKMSSFTCKAVTDSGWSHTLVKGHANSTNTSLHGCFSLTPETPPLLLIRLMFSCCHHHYADQLPLTHMPAELLCNKCMHTQTDTHMDEDTSLINTHLHQISFFCRDLIWYNLVHNHEWVAVIIQHSIRNNPSPLYQKDRWMLSALLFLLFEVSPLAWVFS